ALLGAAATVDVDRVAPMQPRNEGHVVGVAHEHLALWIDRDATPVEDAVVAGIDDRALLARRREDAVVPQALEDDAADHLVDGRRTPHVVLLELALWLVRQRGERLRRRGVVARGRALRNGLLRCGDDQSAVAAIEH